MTDASQSRGALQSVSQKQHGLDLVWSNGQSSYFHYLWLRDNCQTTLHPETRERVFDQLSVAANIHPLELAINNDTLSIVWSEQQHRSQFSAEWLYEHAYSGDLVPENKPAAKSWDCNFLTAISRVNFDDLIHDDTALLRWMQQLDRDGLSLVTNMPSIPTALDEVANRIDYQRRTNFGVTFEVRSEPNPINLAYTNLALPLHTDLSNFETPPGYQFLHCLANDCEGGESVFADGLKVLEDMRIEQPAYFTLLASHAIPYRFHDDKHDIRHHHPVINLDHNDNIVELKYNAHLAGVFDLPEAIMHDYYIAYRDLMARLRSDKYRIKFTSVEGTMTVFDNRRVLHGREAFAATGRRHLRGCYVDRTEFQSRLRTLKNRH